MKVAIREARSGALLAEGEVGADVFKYEGNWYFAPERVERGLLRESARTSTRPTTGTCSWLDYVGPDGRTAQNVAWVHHTTAPGHELIAGRYGFYPGTRGATRQD